MASNSCISLLISALIFLVLVESGYCIKCWVCRSDSDPKCADPFDNSTVPITDCKQEPELPHIPGVRPQMCRKIRQKVHGEWRYFRSCAYIGEPGIEGDERFCLMRTGTYNIFMEYCTCMAKDGCNSAGRWTTSLWLGLSLSVLAWQVPRMLGVSSIIPLRTQLFKCYDCGFNFRI